MSLINQVLKDLEERHATGIDAQKLHAAVRPVPRSRGRSRWPLVIALVGLAGVGSGGWWLGLRQEATAARPTLAAQVPAGADLRAAPAPLDAPSAARSAPQRETGVSMQGLPQSPRPVDAAESRARPPQALARQAARPKSDDALALAQPAKPRRPAATPRAREPEVRAAPAAQADPQAAAEAASEAPLIVVEEPAAIDKQMRWSSTAERAQLDYERGIHLYEEGRTSEAQTAWSEALETDPANLPARHALLGLLLERGEREQAMRVVQEGLLVDPGQLRLRMILARMQLDIGASAEALRTLEPGLAEPAAGGDYLATAAAVMARAGRNREAAALYQRALSQTPGNPVWYIGLGMALRTEGRSAEALAAFESVRAAKSLSPELQAFVDGQVRKLR